MEILYRKNFANWFVFCRFAVEQINVKQMSTNKTEIEMLGQQSDGKYLVKLDGASYLLDAAQYKAINRKKEMPASRLEIWLKSYADENI